LSATLVDSNVLIDVATDDPSWTAWSTDALARQLEAGPLVINPIIFAEISVNYLDLETLDSAFPRDIYRREDLPWDAAFLAGKCFVKYRRRGGTRRTPLPDFYIGAHAVIRGYHLLTRDRTRYADHFPKLRIISP
jgi:predicted nucleic acid-binding protein